MGERVAGKYVTQIMWQLACTGRAFCDFVSFDPRMPPEMRLFVSRIHRDDKRILELEIEVEAFLADLDFKLRELTKRYAPPVNLISAG